MVFGKLWEFAKTLSKGAHIQIEGELRSREYDSKRTDSRQRVWEIRASSILTLDRTEKSAPEDQDQDDETQEDRRVSSRLSLSEARSMTGLSLPSGSHYEFRIHRAISETDRTVFRRTTNGSRARTGYAGGG